MDTIKMINYILTVIFFICYAYQAVYVIIPFVVKEKPHKPAKRNRFAVLISARNEQMVIGNLIDSINRQTYPGELITTFVVADNCTDETARIAREHGAVVFERFNAELVGKGYALNWLLERIDAAYPDKPFDAYIVFDADNVLEPNYVEEMNRTFSDGYEVITSYRNSKNFGDNWISSGYALWCMRESSWLNRPRMRAGTSCAVSGTGFMFSRKVLDECGGWNFFLLTEDIEFTVDNVVNDRKIGYCEHAVLYDEQPTRFKQSFNQRKRWARGYVQVFGKYGRDMTRSVLHGSFASYDMFMNILPAAFVSIVGIIINVAGFVVSIVTRQNTAVVIGSAVGILNSMYLTVFAIGALTTISEWKRIYAPSWKKILYTFTFPLFMLTYIPCMLAGVFARTVTWKPIEHTRAANLAEIREGARRTA